MLDAVAALLTYQASIYFTTGQARHRMGNRHPSIAPYDTFDAADGAFVLAVGNDGQFRALCGLLGRDALATEARFATNAARVDHAEALRAELAPSFATRTRGELIAVLTGAGVPAGAVRDVGEVLRDPQLLHRAMVETIEHPLCGTLAQLGLPIKLSETPGAIRRPPPLLGEHTERVLGGDLGMGRGEIGRLREEGVV
jgi:crotonobetainyl-CoA:carnitine CoA-transferase CaiB-like acyl-CoA transferase